MSLSTARKNFQEEVNKRRASLTPRELEFLIDLGRDGSQDNIAQAQGKLCEIPVEEDKGDLDADTLIAMKVPAGVSLTKSVSETGMSRREESLQNRRQSQLHGQIWKAHENGLAVSVKSSRQSVLRRGSSSMSGSGSINLSKRSPLLINRRQVVSHHDSLTFALYNDNNNSNSNNENLKLPELGLSSSLNLYPQHRSCNRRGTLSTFLPFPQSQHTNRHKSISSTTTTTTTTTTTMPPKRKLSESGSNLLCISEEERRSKDDQVWEGTEQDKMIGEEMSKSLQTLMQHQEQERKLDHGDDEEDGNQHYKQEDAQNENSWKQGLHLIRRASVNDYGGEGMEIDANTNELNFNDSTLITSDSETCFNKEGKEEETKGKMVDNLQQHTMVMRRATMNVYDGQGLEVSDWDAQEIVEERRDTLDSYRQQHGTTTSNTNDFLDSVFPFTKSSSFDERLSVERPQSSGILEEASTALFRSLSEDEISSALLSARHQSKRERRPSFHTQTTSASEVEEENEWYGHFEYDAWVDAPEEDGGVIDLVPFRILGTSADDIDAHPHVLSPPLMESIQAFFPMAKTSDNFWMKYSLVRDGASMHTLLQHARGAEFSILALETVDGEVMGAFTTEPWRKTWSCFGGSDSFLWRMRHSRQTKCHSIIDQAHLESEIDVYPYTGTNECIQFCTSEKMAVGGGVDQCNSASDSMQEKSSKTEIRGTEWGHGICLDRDLLCGSSAPCITFGSPSLSETHSDGSKFEIINLELWTMTPCYSLADAEKLELGKLFLQEHSFTA